MDLSGAAAHDAFGRRKTIVVSQFRKECIRLSVGGRANGDQLGGYLLAPQAHRKFRLPDLGGK